MKRMIVFVALAIALVGAGCGAQKDVALPHGSIITWHGRSYEVSGNTVPDSRVRCNLGQISGVSSPIPHACRLVGKDASSPNKTIAIHLGPGKNVIAFFIGE